MRSIRHQDHDITRGVQHRGADLASLQMLVDFGVQHGIHLAIDIGGDVFPHGALQSILMPVLRTSLCAWAQTLSVAEPAPVATMREPDAAGL